MIEKELVAESELKRVADTIATHYNVDFTNYAPSSFKRRLERIITLYKFPDVDTMLQKVLTNQAFFNEFLEEITVNTTELFRDHTLWLELREKLNFKYRKNTHILVWHAGCSSGEEVISMAILMKELGLHDKYKALATDINGSVLQQASKGMQRRRNLPEYEKNYMFAGGTAHLSDYYTTIPGNHEFVQFHPELLSNVKFRKFDLVKDQNYLKFDMILCRNVLIYFNKDLQDQVGKMFSKAMFPSSWLILGSKESLVWCSIANEFRQLSQENKIYELK